MFSQVPTMSMIAVCKRISSNEPKYASKAVSEPGEESEGHTTPDSVYEARYRYFLNVAELIKEDEASSRES